MVIERVKDSNIFIGLKKTCLGGLEREDRDRDNATGLNEGGGVDNETGFDRGRRNRNVNYSAFHIRDAPLSFALNTYLST